MAERKSSQLPPSSPRQNREDLPTLVVAPRISIERNRAHLNLLDDGHRDLTELRRTYRQLEERQLNQDRMSNNLPSINDIDDSPVRTVSPFFLHFGFPSVNDIPDMDQQAENVSNIVRVNNSPPPVLHFGFSSGNDIPDVDQQAENVSNNARVRNSPFPVLHFGIPDTRNIPPPTLHITFQNEPSSPQQNSNEN